MGSRKRYSRGALLQRLRRRKASPSELESTVATLVEDGHLDSVHGYTLALRMADSGEQWEWAMQLLDMCRKGPGLEVTACNVGIAACARSLQWERALMVLDGMSRDDVVPDIETYQKATSACSRSGKWEAALVVLKCAIEEGLANGETYGIGMMACASADGWRQALSMLYGIDNCGIPKIEKDLLSYGVAVFGCERGGLAVVSVASGRNAVWSATARCRDVRVCCASLHSRAKVGSCFGHCWSDASEPNRWHGCFNTGGGLLGPRWAGDATASCIVGIGHNGA